MNLQVRNYQIGKELGRGTFGVTYYGYDTVKQREVAVKTIDINKSISIGSDLSSINDEIQTLREITGTDCSKYIACFYDSFQDNFQGVPTMFIISEYIKGNSLTDFIIANNAQIHFTVLWPLYLQLLIGLKFIHSKGYAHRDIKTDNILITEDFTIKYIDFGLACLQRCQVTSCTNTCKGLGGTLFYMPPEFFNGTYVESLEASQAHDMWSLAIVMSEMALGIRNFPFKLLKDDNSTCLPEDQIMAHIAQAPEYYADYQLDFKDGRTNKFLDSLLVNNWRKRPNVWTAKRMFVNNVLAKVWIQ